MNLKKNPEIISRIQVLLENLVEFFKKQKVE